MSNPRRPLTRRDVIRTGLAAAALGAVHSACSRSGPAAPPTPAATPSAPTTAAASKKRILILGGTGFIGPKTIEVAAARGHSVTIFNRGKREKFLPLKTNVEHLYGNRDPKLPADDEKGPDGKLLHPDASPVGLEQLVGKSWDVVIDNSGFFPRMVGASAELLAKNAAQYIYISSVSAYDGSAPNGGDENFKLSELSDPNVETMGASFENYGGLKVLCEKAAAAAFPGRATIVRPGYIVGPGDPTDRFTYWPVRIAQGGDVLAPGSQDDPLQVIDVRDLAEWLITLAENGTAGTFNAVGPATPARWGNVLDACVAAAPAQHPKLEWVSADWLDKHGMGDEDAFPIWAPPVGKFAGFHRWSNERAKAAGLKFRSVADTVKGILDWYPGEIERRVRVTHELQEAAKAKGAPLPKGPPPEELRAGPARKREQELLAQWRADSKKK